MGNITGRDKSLARCVSMCQYVNILQPIPIITGAVAWATVSKLESLDGTIETGIFILVVSTFFTLFATALFGLSYDSAKRRNLNLLNDIETDSKQKAVSADITVDITSNVYLK